jgi:hypothetical protein
MISTKFYDERGKDVLQTLRTQTSHGHTTATAALPGATRAVLNRWMRSAYLC